MRVRQAHFKDAMSHGFWVTLYFIFDGQRTFTFFDQSEWLESGSLMVQNGDHIHSFYKDVLCTPTHLPDLYLEASSQYVK